MGLGDIVDHVTSNTRTPLPAGLSDRCICADELFNQISGCAPVRTRTAYQRLTDMHCMQMVCASLGLKLRNNLGMESGKLAENRMNGQKEGEAGLHDSHVPPDG